MLIIGAAIVGAWLVLNDTGTIRTTGGGGGSGAFSGYTGASKPAISGIAGAAAG